MKHSLSISILLIVSLIGRSQDSTLKKLIPAGPIGWVSDFEKTFTAEQVNFFDSVIARHEKETTNQIAIVTIELDTISIKSIDEFEQFTLQLFNQWGIGQKDKANGVAIIFSKKLGKVRIETGFGLEAKLTNAEAKLIIDSLIIPEFKKANYFEGTLNGLQEIIKEIQ